MDKSTMIETIGKSLLLGIECVLDNFFVVTIEDDKIKLIDIKVNDEFCKYLLYNKMLITFPDNIELFSDDCLYSLKDVYDKFYSKYSMDDIKFYFKFTSTLTYIPSTMFKSFNKIDFDNTYIGGIIAKGVENLDIYNLYLPYVSFLDLSSMEVSSKTKFKYGALSKDTRLNFKNFSGTIGTLYMDEELKNGKAKEYISIISDYVKNQFENEKYLKIESIDYVYDNIFGISLESSKCDAGVDICLDYIPTLSDFYEYYTISEMGKEIINSGVIKLNENITVLSNYCFNIPSEVQERIGSLEIELSPNLRKVDRRTFSRLTILKKLTILGKPHLLPHFIYRCDNIEEIFCKEFKITDFSFYALDCNESVMLYLSDFTGTLAQLKEKILVNI